mgnify:FL=1|jgi:hypothetical protein|tara:strand:- start:1287 stop:2276 length:990 start_codon:yes stop_codon:yes gene_type:complete
MPTVRLVKDWKEPDIIKQQTPNMDGIWDNVYFTFEEIRECDYLIVFNRAKHQLKIMCTPGNKWLISGEPPNPAFRWQKKSYKYFDRIFAQHKQKFHKQVLSHGALPWQIKMNYLDLINLESNSTMKKNKVSFVTSNSDWMSGHQIRLKFLKYLQNSKYDFDLFGKGINPIDNKFDALYPYKYSIAIENSFYPHYWTDKIADCFLSWTMPFYFGAPNINKYFPKDSFVLINPKKPKKALDKIKRSVDEGIWEKNIGAIKEARELILNKYQFFPFIVNEINKRDAKTDRLIKKSYFIPQNIAPWEEGGKNLISLGRKIEWRIRKSMNLKPY